MFSLSGLVSGKVSLIFVSLLKKISDNLYYRRYWFYTEINHELL